MNKQALARIAVVALLVGGAYAAAQALYPSRRQPPVLQKATEALPTSGAALCDAGMDLTSIIGYAPCVASTTIGLWLDGGVLEAYWLDPKDTTQASCGTLKAVPELDETIPTGRPLQNFCGGDVETIVWYGRVYYRARGVALSNGTFGDDGGFNLSTSITGRVGISPR